MMDRITILLGAGAVAEINGPQTDVLTDIAIAKTGKIFKEDPNINNIPFLDMVCDRLKEYYGQDYIINFEDIYHTLEQLYAFSVGTTSDSSKIYKPSIAAFTAFKKEIFLNRNYLRPAIGTFVKSIIDVVYEKSNIFDPADKDKWFVEFWKGLCANYDLDIATLNYDDYIEKSIDNINDGYGNEKYLNIHKFNPKIIIDNGAIKNRIMHLHGSIYYGTSSGNMEDEARGGWNYAYEELYKYDDFNDAGKSTFHPSSNQRKEMLLITSIITGLGKTDKIVYYPFTIYSWLFQKAVIENPRLLIVGYSFSDIYINAVLERINQLHGANRKIVVIDKLNAHDYIDHFEKDKVLSDITERRHDIINHNLCDFVMRVFNRTNPFEEFKEDGKYIQSKDGRARVYIEGFKNAANDKYELFKYLSE